MPYLLQIELAVLREAGDTMQVAVVGLVACDENQQTPRTKPPEVVADGVDEGNRTLG